jgi:hypothetical protein
MEETIPSAFRPSSSTYYSRPFWALRLPNSSAPKSIASGGDLLPSLVLLPQSYGIPNLFILMPSSKVSTPLQALRQTSSIVRADWFHNRVSEALPPVFQSPGSLPLVCNKQSRQKRDRNTGQLLKCRYFLEIASTWLEVMPILLDYTLGCVSVMLGVGSQGYTRCGSEEELDMGYI